MRRLLVAALAAVSLSGLLFAPPASAEIDRDQAWVTSADGTRLHVEVFRSDHVRGRRPVVLLVSPYLNGSGQLAYGEFELLLKKGYAVVQASLRGFGPSNGCSDFGGKGEQADVKAFVEWSAKQAWSNGRVGMWGVSYDAWTQVMALATKPKGLAATLIQSPLVGLYRGLYMNGAHYGGGWHATPANYAVIDLQGSGDMAPTDAPCYAANNTETAVPDATTAFWKERDLVARAAGSKIPVLWSHGFLDAATKPDNLSALYPLLRGPKRAWVGQFPHALPHDRFEPAVYELYRREAFDWLDAYVAGDAAALRRVRAASRAVVQRDDSKWRRDDAWPPRDSRGYTTELRSGQFVDIPNNDGGLGNEAGAVHWSISQPLPYDVHLSGVPRVTFATATPNPVQVVVKVFSIEPSGAARMITRGVHAFVGGKVSFDLYPQDWRIPKGNRIGVAMLGSDGTWWSPSTTGGAVLISDASIRLPWLTYDRAYRPVLWDEGSEGPHQFVLPASAITAGATKFVLPPKMRRR